MINEQKTQSSFIVGAAFQYSILHKWFISDVVTMDTFDDWQI